MVLLWQVACIASSKVEGYAATVDGVPGGPPLAHWHMGEAGGPQITDRKGARHGTYSGTIGYGAAGLPQNSDGAIDFGGTGMGTVRHDAGLALSAFSLSFWFRLPVLPEDGVFVLVSKDQSGLNIGDFTIWVDETGTLIVQFQNDSAAFQLAPSTVAINTTDHLCVRADGTGFDAYLNGRYLGKNTGFTDGWANNSQAIGFAHAPWSSVFADAILDEVALYGRILTEAEVIELAQSTEVPVATNDSFLVQENQTTVLPVADNDTYTGAKANLTVEIVSQASHGTATVRSDKDIDFAADDVATNQADSFTYRIKDANGTSNAATVSLTIEAAGGGGGATYWVATNGNDANPGSEESPFKTIVKGLNTALPGDTVTVKPGSYAGFVWPKSGSSGNPITLKAQFPASTTSVENRTVLNSGSGQQGAIIYVDDKDHVVVDGLYATQGGTAFIRLWNGDDAVVKNCRVEYLPGNVIKNGVSLVRYSNVTIQNNVFIDEGPIQDNPVMDYAVNVYYSASTDTQIINNYFFGRYHQCVSFKHSVPSGRIAHNTFDGAHFTSVYLGQTDDSTGDATSSNLICEYNHFRDGRDSQNRYYRLQNPIQIRNVAAAIVRYNLIENCSGAAAIRVVEPGDTGGDAESRGTKPLDAQIYGNVIIFATTDAFEINGRGYNGDDIGIYNNTVYQCNQTLNPINMAQTPSWKETSNPGTIQFKNNNVSGSANGTGNLATTTFRNNNWHNSGSARDASDLTVDPQFVGTPARHTPGPPAPVFTPDFSKFQSLKLAGGSQLINAGTDVGLPSGLAAPDIGHNEF